MTAQEIPSSLSSVTVDIVVPVRNDERALPGCVAVLHKHLTERMPFDWTITIVDNASTDGTRQVAKSLAGQWSKVRVVGLPKQGKGNALRPAWSSSQADVVAYTDVELSTGLDALISSVASRAAGRPDLGTDVDPVPPRQNVSRLRHLLMFGAVGVVATLMTLVLYTVFRMWWPPLVANLVAVTLSTLVNTEANRRFTFRGRSASLALAHVQALVVFGMYTGFTSGALLLLHAAAASPPRWVELAVLLAASAIGTLGRFVLLNTWVFRSRPGSAPGRPAKESLT